MALTIIELPHVGESVTEGVISKWLVEPGQRVRKYDLLVEVMTDKATVVISSPRAGKLTEACFAEGDVAEVGAVLFVLDVEGEEAAAEVAPEIPDVPKPRGTGGAGGS